MKTECNSQNELPVERERRLQGGKTLARAKLLEKRMAPLAVNLEDLDEIVRPSVHHPLQDITRRAEEEQNSLMLEPIPWETKFEPQLPTPEQSKPELSLPMEPCDLWFSGIDILGLSKTPRDSQLAFTNKSRAQGMDCVQNGDGLQYFQDFDLDQDMPPLAMPYAPMR